MKKAALTSLVIFTFCGLVCAGPEAFSGKDMKQVVPVPTCEINWTGFYAGLHVGYGFSDADIHDFGLPPANFVQLPSAVDPGEEGFLGGIQVGYNRQFGAFVVGVEADISGTDMDGTGTAAPIIANGAPVTNSELTVHRDTDWFGTFRGRIGFTPHCRLLLYATGGLAVGDVHAFGSAIGGNVQREYAASSSEFEIGWTAGAGGEIALTRRWSLKFEYLYYSLDDQSFVANPVPPNPPFQVRYTADASAYTFNTGLNFHF